MVKKVSTGSCFVIFTRESDTFMDVHENRAGCALTIKEKQFSFLWLPSQVCITTVYNPINAFLTTPIFTAFGYIHSNKPITMTGNITHSNRKQDADQVHHLSFKVNSQSLP